MTLETIRDNSIVVSQQQLASSPSLLKQVQAELARLALYPQNQIDGIWGNKTKLALAEFCHLHFLNNLVSQKYGPTFASKLLTAHPAALDIAPEFVAHACRCPVANVKQYLPMIVRSLKDQKIYSKRVLVAVLATVGVETPHFAPIKEIGDRAYFTRMYEGRPDLGNIAVGDGAAFCGRGFIQITGRANYRMYGKRLGIDLEGNPNLALDPEISAKILALYFRDRNVHLSAERGNWRMVRRAVNGGYNGWNHFAQLVTAFTGCLNC